MLQKVISAVNGGGGSNTEAAGKISCTTSTSYSFDLPFTPNVVSYFITNAGSYTGGAYNYKNISHERTNAAYYMGTSTARTTPSGITINGQTVSIDTTKVHTSASSIFNGGRIYWSAYADT